METQIISSIDMEACGKTNMQASPRRNQNPRKRPLLGLDSGRQGICACDQVRHGGKKWVCGRKHERSGEKKRGQGYRYWKEAG